MKQVTLVQGGDSLVIPSSSPEEVTARTSSALFETLPAAVLADPSADLATAADTGTPVLVVSESPPARVAWGWKNLHDEDQPMLTPQQTVDQVHPVPVMISYQ